MALQDQTTSLENQGKSHLAGPAIATAGSAKASPHVAAADGSAGQAKKSLVDRLQKQIRSLETIGRIADEVRVSSGCDATDRLLPSSGYERGALVQWLTGGGQAADYLSLLVAREACRDGGALVILDPHNQFFPPAAAAIGINLDHMVVLKTPAVPNTDLWWSIDQALRCPAVAAVWGPMGPIDERWFRRFQLSAESSGCLGLFVQPLVCARQPTWADVQWLVGSEQPVRHPVSQRQGTESGQHVRLQLTRCRGTQTGKSVQLLINTITGNVRAARSDHGELRGQFCQEQRDPKSRSRAARHGELRGYQAHYNHKAS